MDRVLARQEQCELVTQAQLNQRVYGGKVTLAQPMTITQDNALRNND